MHRRGPTPSLGKLALADIQPGDLLSALADPDGRHCESCEPGPTGEAFHSSNGQALPWP